MDPFTTKANRQRWALIKECMDGGVWESEEDFRNWLFIEFGTRSQRELNAVQIKTLWTYLMWYAGKMPDAKMKLDGVRKPWHASRRQLHRMEELQKELDWDDDTLNTFIARQLGVASFPKALSKQAATKVLVGMERTITHKIKKHGNRTN